MVHALRMAASELAHAAAHHSLDSLLTLHDENPRTVKDAVVHENVVQHAHHEVTPIVNREREETEIHQKVQPIM